jgi:mRNA-degrading endonuclease YafQ of YafQ-DinJ toxin-antitoxin module
LTREFASLEFTDTFLGDLVRGNFSAAETAATLRALELLDANERHPSLRVHALQGPLVGVWSAAASKSLRLTFERLPGGRKRLLTFTRHYDR